MALLHVVDLRIDAARTAVLILGNRWRGSGRLRSFRQAE